MIILNVIILVIAAVFKAADYILKGIWFVVSVVWGVITLKPLRRK
jgi:hypothetical protein